MTNSFKSTVLPIAFAAVLVGILYVTTEISHMSARRSQCGHNLKQILAACLVYSESEDVPWLLPTTQQWSAASIAADAHAARLVTARGFEILSDDSLIPNSVFTCSACAFPGPVLRARSDGRNGDAWGAARDHAVSYAFDWSATANPSASRVIASDRDPANHRGTVMAVFGDTHTERLKVATTAVDPASGMFTENSDGKPVERFVPGNADGSDNIFSSTGDGAANPLAAGGGDRLRAWVK
jgi:hypothetical protein